MVFFARKLADFPRDVFVGFFVPFLLICYELELRRGRQRSPPGRVAVLADGCLLLGRLRTAASLTGTDLARWLTAGRERAGEPAHSPVASG